MTTSKGLIALAALSVMAATFAPTEQWVEIGVGSADAGGITNSSGSSSTPSLALDSSGFPVIAWADNSSGNYEIYIRRWNGVDWFEVGSTSASFGGISNNAGTSWSPSLALDGSGNPVVAWSDFSATDAEIYVRRWTGLTWIEVGTGSASAGGISNNTGASALPSLALDASGSPVVAWEDDSGGDTEIYVRRWNGLGWIEVGTGSATGGGISNNASSSGEVSLALDDSGDPVVAWQDASSGDYEIYVLRWSGLAWVEIGTGSSAGGGISNNAGGSGGPSLALDGFDNPTVAWADDSDGDNEVYIRRWNGSAWVEVGTGSASSGGISNNAAESYAPSLALQPSGNPVIAWQDDSSGDFDILVLRWNGLAWVDFGAGSGSGGGVSNTTVVASGISVSSSLALDGNGHPVVAWQESAVGGPEILVAAFEMRAPAGLDQTQDDGSVFVTPGASVGSDAVALRASLPSFLPTTLALQVEVRPVGTAFSDSPTAESLLVDPGSQTQVLVSGLANGSYHWQARTRTATNLTSSWVSFGNNAESSADFVVAVPSPDPIIFDDDKGRCGLLGIEPLLLLGLLAFRRRRAA